MKPNSLLTLAGQDSSQGRCTRALQRLHTGNTEVSCERLAPVLMPSLQRCHSCMAAPVSAGQTPARMIAPAIAMQTGSWSHKPRHRPRAMASAIKGSKAKAKTGSCPAESETCTRWGKCLMAAPLGTRFEIQRCSLLRCPGRPHRVCLMGAVQFRKRQNEGHCAQLGCAQPCTYAVTD